MCVVCIVNDSVVNHLRQTIMYCSIQSYEKSLEKTNKKGQMSS